MVRRQTIKEVTDIDVEGLDHIASTTDEHAFGAWGMTYGADFYLVELVRKIIKTGKIDGGVANIAHIGYERHRHTSIYSAGEPIECLYRLGGDRREGRQNLNPEGSSHSRRFIGQPGPDEETKWNVS